MRIVSTVLALLAAGLAAFWLMACCGGCAAAGGHRVTTSQPVEIETAQILAKAEATLSAVNRIQGDVSGIKTDIQTNVVTKLAEIHNSSSRQTTYNCGNPWLLGFIAFLVAVLFYIAWRHDPKGKSLARNG